MMKKDLNRIKTVNLLRLSRIVTFIILPMNSLVGQPNPPEAFPYFDKVYSEELAPEYDEYNFWNGHWDVSWKTWKELDIYQQTGAAIHRVFSALDGKALIELAYDDSITLGSKTAGFSIRYFDSNLDKWVMLQSWPGRNASNISSLQGTHHLGRIQLYQYGKTSGVNKNIPAGTPFANRYTFSDARDESFRWDSGFSVDSMRTWFTRDIAEFTRRPDFTSLREDGTDYWYTYGDGYNCDDSVLQDLRPFIGEWKGETVYFDGQKTVKTTRVLVPFLSNCAAFGYQVFENEDEMRKEIVFTTYLANSAEWVFYSLNNVKGESQTLYFSKTLKESEASFAKRDLFDVPSSNQVEVIKWEMTGKKKHRVKAYDLNNELIYKTTLSKMK